MGSAVAVRTDIGASMLLLACQATSETPPLSATKTPPAYALPDPMIGSGAAALSKPERRFSLSR